MKSIIKGWLDAAVSDVIEKDAVVDAHIDYFYEEDSSTSIEMLAQNYLYQ